MACIIGVLVLLLLLLLCCVPLSTGTLLGPHQHNNEPMGSDSIITSIMVIVATTWYEIRAPLVSLLAVAIAASLRKIETQKRQRYSLDY